MHTAVVILCLTIFVTGKNIRNATYKAHPRIIGGHPVPIRQRPFMLSLHDSDEFVCGASILSETWGITALHCLIPMYSAKYYVRAGSEKSNTGGSIHTITRIHVYNDSTYPYWFSDMLCHDIAVFEVSPPFRFSRNVRSVRLPRENSKPPQKLYVSGWGHTGLANGHFHNTLMGVYVYHVPFATCIKDTPAYSILVKKDYHLCYGGPRRDACYGDSGGPLATRRILYGLVSFGENCGKVAGVYVKVSYYRQWINSITNL